MSDPWSFERDEEPTAAFTPSWDPLWDDESPWPPSSLAEAPLAAPVGSQPDPPLSAPVPVSDRRSLGTEGPLEKLVPPDSFDEIEPAAPGFRTADTPNVPAGRTRRFLSRFRSAIVLAIVVALSGVAVALAFGVVVGVLGLFLKKTAGG